MPLLPSCSLQLVSRPEAISLTSWSVLQVKPRNPTIPEQHPPHWLGQRKFHQRKALFMFLQLVNISRFNQPCLEHLQSKDKAYQGLFLINRHCSPNLCLLPMDTSSEEPGQSKRAQHIAWNIFYSPSPRGRWYYPPDLPWPDFIWEEEAQRTHTSGVNSKMPKASPRAETS